jgi:hypothetical protein
MLHQVHNAGKQQRVDNIGYVREPQLTQSDKTQCPDGPRLVEDSEEEADNSGAEWSVRHRAREGGVDEALGKCEHDANCGAVCESSQDRERDNHPNLEMGAVPGPHLARS